MATIVRKEICSAVQSAGPFSLLAEVSTDISKTQQLTVVLRYVDASCGSIHEHFLKFVQTTNFSAESLSKCLLDTLKDYHLDPKWTTSQGYDGALVMSRRCSGVQKCTSFKSTSNRSTITSIAFAFFPWQHGTPGNSTFVMNL